MHKNEHQNQDHQYNQPCSKARAWATLTVTPTRFHTPPPPRGDVRERTGISCYYDNPCHFPPGMHCFSIVHLRQDSRDDDPTCIECTAAETITLLLCRVQTLLLLMMMMLMMLLPAHQRVV